MLAPTLQFLFGLHFALPKSITQAGGKKLSIVSCEQFT